jgi:NAD(P)-dependent dehydrogenase (short-subunit alcohol dehydrogenase family)
VNKLLEKSVQNLFNLSGKVAIITGGAGLLGRQMSEALGEAGARVVIASRNILNCQAWVEHLKRRGIEAIALQVDVTSRESIFSMVKNTKGKYGRLDILVNSALNRGEPLSAEKLKQQDWSTWIDVCLSGTFYCSQAAAEIMFVQGKGVIINIGSIYGMMGVDDRMYPAEMPIFATAAYSASKGGILTLTRYLAVAWAKRGIRVNCLSPGGFRHDDIHPQFEHNFVSKVPLGRMGDNNDLKGAIVFLASDASLYMTGQNLIIDGGWSAW